MCVARVISNVDNFTVALQKVSGASIVLLRFYLRRRAPLKLEAGSHSKRYLLVSTVPRLDTFNTV